ncbi:DUF903 domain-containing protein [Pusillimonas sp.]|uniref:DUF903 domain-containing protein n=1 Tax=Pusillimonas sp. TaxID=3040095 RepID=UPI0037CC7367
MLPCRGGQTIVTGDRPEVDDDKDFITYERDGNESHINKPLNELQPGSRINIQLPGCAVEQAFFCCCRFSPGGR